MDIREDADHIYVEADLPGFRKEDVDISIENDMLTITAERRRKSPTSRRAGRKLEQGDAGKSNRSQGEYLLRERRIQRFVRSFTLPPTADPQSVQAKMENGVLRITLNKSENAKPRHIAVA